MECPFEEESTSELRKSSILMKNLYDRMLEGSLKKQVTVAEVNCLVIAVNGIRAELRLRDDGDGHDHPEQIPAPESPESRT